MGQRMPSANKYDLLRQKAKQSVKAGEQEQQDAIARRYASLGMGGSGAAIKTQRDIQDKSQQNLQSANEAIGFQEAAEQERRADIEAERAFQRGEREAGQKFASGETALQRKFLAAERAAGQKFASEEAGRQRGFLTSERQAGQKFQESQFSRQLKTQIQQFEKQFGLALKQFQLDERIANKNLELQEKMANKKNYFESHLDVTKRLSQGRVNAQDLLTGGDVETIGGGSVICTDYYKNGWISEEIFKSAQDYSSKYVTRREKANYQAWAKGYLDLVQKLPILRYLMWPIFSRCIYFMAGRQPILGKMVYNLVFKYTTKSRAERRLAHGN